MPILYLVTISSNLAYGQSVEIYDNPLLGFKFQYPSEWKEVMTEGAAGIAFSPYKLPNSNPNAIDTVGFLTLDVPQLKNLKQFLRELNFIVKINFSSLKIADTHLSGLPALNATWTDWDGYTIQLIYAVKDSTLYGSMYKASRLTWNDHLPEVNNILKSFQITG